jgi:hydroxyacylglutathione hydrolase
LFRTWELRHATDRALPAFTDNYIWLLQDTPANAAPWSIRATPRRSKPGWQATSGLDLERHPDHPSPQSDHVGGVEQLHQATTPRSGARPRKPSPARQAALNDNDRIEVLGLAFEVLYVPGHTLGHIAFYHAHGNPLLFCGDTLFAAGCGVCLKAPRNKCINSLEPTGRAARRHTGVLHPRIHPKQLALCPGGGAGQRGYRRTRLNKSANLASQGKISLPLDIALELRTNPFLRVNETSVKEKADEWGNSDNLAGARSLPACELERQVLIRVAVGIKILNG